MQTYEELLAENAALKVENATLKARVAELEARLAALEAMLAMSSAVTPLVTVFLVHAKRGTVAAKELLGSFAGILVSDRWSAYSFVDAVRRQLCWAHLLRDFEWIAEFGGEAAATGKAPVERAKRMFQWWHEFKAGSLSRSGFQQRMAPLMERLEALLEEGVASAHKKTAGKCRKILESGRTLDVRQARGRGADPPATRRSGP